MNELRLSWLSPPPSKNKPDPDIRRELFGCEFPVAMATLDDAGGNCQL
jgi:hypothetical protein